MRKKFDPKLHEQFDKPAKEATLKLLKSYNIDAIENPDKYGVDILIEEIDYCIDCEIRTAWKDDHFIFPFNDIQIPKAKVDKLFEKINPSKISFFIWNVTTDRVMEITGKKLIKSNVISKTNRLSPDKLEEFYSVNIAECELHELPNEKRIELKNKITDLLESWQNCNLNMDTAEDILCLIEKNLTLLSK